MKTGMNMKRKQIANQLGMSDYALKRKMRNLNITMRMRYTRIDDEVVKQLVDEIFSINQNLGTYRIVLSTRINNLVNNLFFRGEVNTISIKNNGSEHSTLESTSSYEKYWQS